MTTFFNKPFSIGLVAHSGKGWMGGGLYIAHIFESLLAWRCANPDLQLRIIIICANSEQLISEFPIYSNADGFISPVSLSLPAKIVDKGASLLSILLPYASLPSLQTLDFVKHNLNFVYPYACNLNPVAGPRSAAWIPDFQHRYLSRCFNADEIRSRDLQFGKISRNSSDIIFSSQDSLRSFREFYPRSTAKAHVLSFCSIPSPSLWNQQPDLIRSRYNLPTKFFLCSGQFWIHKNQTLVLRAIHQLSVEISDLFVVFTGHTYDYRFPSCFDEFLQVSNLLGVRTRIAILGLIPRIDQLQLMRASIAVIQPSLFEGWSTVVEDARALGKKILISDLDVHAEQRHPDCLSFAKASPSSLASAMRDTWHIGQSGPDISRENIARSQTSKLVLNMGETFMSIATGSA